MFQLSPKLQLLSQIQTEMVAKMTYLLTQYFAWVLQKEQWHVLFLATWKGNVLMVFRDFGNIFRTVLRVVNHLQGFSEITLHLFFEK